MFDSSSVLLSSRLNPSLGVGYTWRYLAFCDAVNVFVTQEVLGLNEVFVWPNLVNKVLWKTLVPDTFCAPLHNSLTSALWATSRTTDQENYTVPTRDGVSWHPRVGLLEAWWVHPCAAALRFTTGTLVHKPHSPELPTPLNFLTTKQLLLSGGELPLLAWKPAKNSPSQLLIRWCSPSSKSFHPCW